MSLLNSEDVHKISEFDLFRGLSREVLSNVLTGGVSKPLKHREYLYRSGDKASSFCIVVDGALKLIRHSPKGEDIIVHFAVQGDLVGALLMNQSESTIYPISAKSMGPSQVVYVPRSSFQHYWANNVHIQSKLNTVLYRRMNNIQDDKMMFASPLRVRISKLLLRHLDQDSTDTEFKLSIALTRQEIADSLGVAVESVIRAMKELQEDGIITRHVDRGPEFINIKKLLKNIEA